MGVRTAKKAASSKKAKKAKIDLSDLSDEQFEALLDLSQTLVRDDVDEDEDLEDIEDDEDLEDEPPRRTRRKKSKTKITVEKDSEDDGDDDEDLDADPDADLSDDDADRVIRSTERSQFQQMRYDLAERDWHTERDQFVRDGVPPFLLDLAEPFLVLPDPVTIDLSDDEDPLDASEAMRKMLEGVKGIVDLSDEMGHAFDLSDGDEDHKSDADLLLEQWDAQNYG